MKKQTLLTLFLCIATLSFSQENQGGTIGNNATALSNNYSWATAAQMNELRSIVDKQSLSRQAAYANIQGSPFLTTDKVRGTITLNDGKIIQNVPIQYDLYAQAMLVKNKQGVEIVLDSRLYQKIKMQIHHETLVFKKINPQAQDQFYQILFEGPNILFAKKTQALLKEGGNAGVASTDSEFFKKSTYFIRSNNGAIQPVSLKKKKRKQFFAAFPPAQATALQAYSQQHQIKLKKEADFVGLLEQVLGGKLN